MAKSVKHSSQPGVGDQNLTTVSHSGSKGPWPALASLGQPWPALVSDLLSPPRAPPEEKITDSREYRRNARIWRPGKPKNCLNQDKVGKRAFAPLGRPSRALAGVKIGFAVPPRAPPEEKIIDSRQYSRDLTKSDEILETLSRFLEIWRILELREAKVDDSFSFWSFGEQKLTTVLAFGASGSKI